MKEQRVVLLLAVLFVPLLAVMVEAQAETNYATCKVPFAFTAGNQEMPAGEYEITQRDAGLVEINTLDNRHVVVVMTGNVELPAVPANTKLLFNRYGDRYFLARVVRQGDRTASDVLQTPTERRLARAGAPTSIEVGAKPAK